MLKKLIKILTKINLNTNFTCIDCDSNTEVILYINSIDVCYSCFLPLYKIHRKCILSLKKFFINYP